VTLVAAAETAIVRALAIVRLHRDEMEKLVESIPLYYDEDKNPDPPLPCKMAELEYLAKAFEPFLDNSSYLVKNEDYKDDSFYWMDEAKKLRAKIEACIAAGEIEQEQYDKIEELIDLMADVEDKGTHSPKTDPPERDVETNIKHLEKQLEYLLNIRYVLNPHYNPQPFARTQFFADIKTRLESSYENVKIDIFSLIPEDLRAVDDPATFYRPPEAILKTPSNVVFAQSPVTCARIVEIPIGKTLDETIKLVKNILRELKNIWEKGHLIVDKTLEVVEEDGLADQMFDFIDEFLELPEEIPMCEDGCDAECKTHKYTTRDKDGNIEHHCRCSCKCKPNSLMLKIKTKIENKYSEIKTLEKKIKDIYDLIQEAKKSIYESFYKLNSEYPDMYPENGEMVPHPKANLSKEEKRVPIGEDICCTNEQGNCRDNNGNLVETEERDYTLIEKLIWIQKLLNRSRNFEDFKYLIEQLGPLLADEEEIDNVLLIQRIDYTTTGGPLDLTNCTMLYADMVEYTKGDESLKILENCQMAKYYGQIKLEECNPYDPPLDCDYFDFATTTKKTPLNCYCYEEVWYPNYPNIASNFFCCVTKKLEIND
jgi:hypothetical protein